MKKKLLALSISLAFTSVSNNLFAEGNINAGKEKVASCAGCHGANGNSAMPLFPKLAGQHPKYLVQQMLDFKNGTRNDPTMAPMVLALSEEDMQDIAAFYAAQKITANTLPEINGDDDETTEQTVSIDKLIAQGGDLYRNGDLKREVSACIACHGPYGEGNKPAAFPALKSQHADYLVKSLKDFKSDVRSNVPDNMMHMIARKMTDKEINAVAYYVSMMK